MLETDDWKREKIGDYRALSAIVAKYTQSIKEDSEIVAALAIADAQMTKAENLALDRHNTIAEAKEEQQMIKMELIDHWDIDEKTYKCDAGSATMRASKILRINDNSSLLALLFKIERLGKAIKLLDGAYLRKLKDADMIPDAMAVYDSKITVVITEAPK